MEGSIHTAGSRKSSSTKNQMKFNRTKTPKEPDFGMSSFQAFTNTNNLTIITKQEVFIKPDPPRS
jgi:hypothetical protein